MSTAGPAHDVALAAAGLARWRRRAVLTLRRAAGARPLVYAGNRIELLVGGAAYFPQLLAAIESASRSVHLRPTSSTTTPSARAWPGRWPPRQRAAWRSGC